ncbi:MAG: PfkB family carbohydrate kinase, partial [Pseudomonadota bacterium]
MDVSLISIVGDDLAGQELLHNLQLLGIDTAQINISPDGKTAEYLAIFDPSNELVMGVASMDIFDELTGDLITQSKSHIVSSDWVILDCNLPSSAINKVIQFKQQAEFHLAIDTVSISKAKRLPKDLSAIDLLFTNRDEAASILEEQQTIENANIDQVATLLRERGAQGVVITDGARGHITSIGEQSFRTPAISKRIVNVSGAGDALMAGFLYGLRSGQSPVFASHAGAAASSLTVESKYDVRPDLSEDLLNKCIMQIQELVSDGFDENN